MMVLQTEMESQQYLLAISFSNKDIQATEEATYSYYDFYNQNSYYDIVIKISNDTDIDEYLEEIKANSEYKKYIVTKN